MASFSKFFDFNLRRDHQKKFLWASRLWVGRRKEPILGYVSKNDEKNNSGGKGLKTAQNLVTEHRERDFEMIFPFKAAQNLVAERYGRDFDIIFSLYGG